MKKLCSIVIPVFNEIEGLAAFHASLISVVTEMNLEAEIIYVDDGSSDGTGALLESLASTDSRITPLYLSRNFGHQAALTAGLDLAKGDVIISMDSDGQHPPAMLAHMIDLIELGYDIVQTQRIESSTQPFLKRSTSAFFYKIINKISGTYIQPNSADFRALSRQALDGLKTMPEYHRFLRGMIAWMGYKSIILPYEEPLRTAGVSKYSFGKMIRLASDAVFSFSLVPLYIGLSIGGLFIILALVQMIYVAYLWMAGLDERIVPGWSSLMAVLLIASGIIMILLGFLGVYIGYIFQQVKSRPIYLVKKTPDR